MNERDGRTFNYRKGINLQHRIRVLNPGNKSGESLGITLPTVIADQFKFCWMRIHISGTSIILESGCKVTPTDINESQMREITNKQGEVVLIK